MLLTASPFLATAATGLAGAVGLSVTAGGLVVAGTVGVLAYLGISALIGAYKAIKETNEQIEKDPDMNIFEIARFSMMSWRKNTINAVVYPFQWVAKKSLELMGKDVAAEKVGEFDLGEFLFDYTKPGTFAHSRNKLITRAFDWVIGRSEQEREAEESLPFKKKFGLLVERISDIPGRVTDSVKEGADETLFNFKAKFRNFGVYISQLPERIGIAARMLLYRESGGLIGSNLGGLTEAAGKIRLRDLDNIRDGKLNENNLIKQYEVMLRGRTGSMEHMNLSGMMSDAEAQNYNTMINRSSEIQQSAEQHRKDLLVLNAAQVELMRDIKGFIGTPNQTDIYNFNHPIKSALSSAMDFLMNSNFGLGR